jgi:nucleotide-binding universal stress UspA family protein
MRSLPVGRIQILGDRVDIINRREPSMFKTIIWATDGSEHADRALELATQIARANSATLHVAHIVEKQVSTRTAGQDLYYGEDEIGAKISGQVAELQSDSGFETRIQSIPSTVSVAKRIAELARDTDADLIVVGTRGRTALVGAIGGSVTQRLLHLAHCPVLAVPPADQSDTGAEQPDAEQVPAVG